MMNLSLPCILSILLILTACQTPAPSESQTRPPGETALSPAALAAARSGPVDFTRHIKPILEAKCVTCHNHDALPGKVDLSNRESALRTGGLGLWIVPGKPDQSLLLTKISDAPGHLQAMPVVGQQITPDELSILRKWITEGAAWPSGRPGALNIIQ